MRMVWRRTARDSEVQRQPQTSRKYQLSECLTSSENIPSIRASILLHERVSLVGGHLLELEVSCVIAGSRVATLWPRLRGENDSKIVCSPCRSKNMAVPATGMRLRGSEMRYMAMACGLRRRIGETMSFPRRWYAVLLPDLISRPRETRVAQPCSMRVYNCRYRVSHSTRADRRPLTASNTSTRLSCMMNALASWLTMNEVSLRT